MGLTGSSTGRSISKNDSLKLRGGERYIALAGNPNVGKSTVFNALTGMNQHTGNWTGKTVSTAKGRCRFGEYDVILTDLPGTYSLMAHSAEEAVARDYICFGEAEGVIVVCDASCLERNLNLVLQVLEITPSVLVCINLCDEAEKRRITVDGEKLEQLLGVPVVMTSARSGKGLDELKKRGTELLSRKKHIPDKSDDTPYIKYSDAAENAIEHLRPALEPLLAGKLPSRFAALKMLEHCSGITEKICESICPEMKIMLSDSDSELSHALAESEMILADAGIDTAALRDSTVTSIIIAAERLADSTVTYGIPDYCERDRKIDRVLTHRIWGIPVMLLMLAVVFYITVCGANYPSEWLSAAFSSLGTVLRSGLESTSAPPWLISLLMDGIYCTLTWVTAVMLPPMAIFFPLFTLLEDVGYLPRAAFNLDKYFNRSNACGKQALTMAMGLGCNAAGITGCRIIDSPRERMIAVLTNNFMPCNGRFPTLIALISIFLAASAGAASGLISALALTGIIILGAALTFAVSRLLSETLLKGIPSSFALELPPYRKPQIGKVLVRSLFDRTIFVLGRAVTTAAPAGLIIWLLANIQTADGCSVLTAAAQLLDPAARIFGLDGVILMAFILGFPANEIVLPIMLMAYTGGVTLEDYGSLSQLSGILTSNGWTVTTALCTMVFMLCHFPCATSLLTVRKETGSLKWTAAAAVIPTLTGLLLCGIINGVSHIISLI
ncbi:MAG: ferrous iron transport protein B [Huintestinicola sp.]